MQSLSNGYYMLFLSVLLALWLAWFALGRWSLARFARLAGSFAAAGVMVIPFLAGYKSILQDTYGYRPGARGDPAIQRGRGRACSTRVTISWSGAGCTRSETPKANCSRD